MGPYCEKKGGKTQEHWYRLKGVVIHAGDSLKSGHYYSYIKTDIHDDNSWHLFNDSQVSKIGQFPEAQCFGGKWHSGQTYVTFYEKLEQT